MNLEGFLFFSDPPKGGRQESLARLAALGIEVKVVTGDNALVAAEGVRRGRPRPRKRSDRTRPSQP